MVTVMKFSSPAREFPLGSVFNTFPNVTVELERVVPHNQKIIPYFWVRGPRRDGIGAAFEARSGLTGVDLIDSVDGEYFMRASWNAEGCGLIDALTESAVVLLSGVGTADGWTFEVRGESTEAVSTFREACRTHGVPIEIKAVHSMFPIDSDRYDLTDAQYEALVLAYERGYYDTPRAVSLDDIAAELGITQQSLSSRLRRGTHNLIASTIVEY